MKLVAGFDVGGPKKGFHGAVLDLDRDEIVAVGHFLDPVEAISWLPEVLAIAIDAPRRRYRPTQETRPAERAIFQAGNRIQWTRVEGEPAPDWMANGEALWLALEASLSPIPFVETFPTAVSDQLGDCPIKLPLNLLQGKERRKTIPDYWDACLCAWAAGRWLQGEAIVFGADDPLGPIVV